MQHVPTDSPRHVLVSVTGDWSNPAVGLLLTWRNREGVGWEAWVITAEPGPSDTFVRQSWVPASSVRPV